MTENPRVQEIQAQIDAAKAAADRLIARVSDERFKQAVADIKRRITEHELFFIGGLERVNVVNVDMWLTGAQVLLGGEYASLKYYDDEARARNYKIAMI